MSIFFKWWQNQHFQQQKQQRMFLNNKSRKVLMCWLVLLRGPSLCLRTSKVKNGGFLEILKNPNLSNFSTFFQTLFRCHVCSDKYQFFDLTTFVNIIRGTFWQQFGRNFYPRTWKNSIFICGADFFKQHIPQSVDILLFVIVAPFTASQNPKLKKTTVLENFLLKLAPHWRYWGSKSMATILSRSHNFWGWELEKTFIHQLKN